MEKYMELAGSAGKKVICYITGSQDREKMKKQWTVMKQC